jgi:two-component system nitrogen regulation sensor histidine kinase NtrY
VARVSFGRRLFISVLLAGFPATVLGLFLLWTNPYSLHRKVELTIVILIPWISGSFSIYEKTVNAIRGLSSVVSSLQEEDFSVRAAQAIPGDALGDLAVDVNALARALEEERLGTLETVNLFRSVMDASGAATLAFSAENRLRLINRAAANLLGRDETFLLHRTAQELGIDDLLAGPSSETIRRTFLDIERRWLVRRTHFRFYGVPHLLVVMSEASQALRAEERLAWQNIVRVLGHEINNSLAPIQSIADTLDRESTGVVLPDSFKQKLQRGLQVIANRSESLNRFLHNYARLSKLPPPKPSFVSLNKIVSEAIALEPRFPITVVPGPNVNIFVDADQLTQVFINLLRNAVEATLENLSPEPHLQAVTVSWEVHGADLLLWIRDHGIGLSNTQNLFVPFYTTKEKGSGIGLVLCRQIIESHNGYLTIQNRKDVRGCEVAITLSRCVIDNVEPIADALPKD